METLRIGVIGVGRMGANHARIAGDLKGAELVGVYDADSCAAEAVAGRHGGRAYGSAGELIEAADALVIAVPTTHHAEYARACLDARKHLLVEKPLTLVPEYAEELALSARRAGVTAGVGHVERYNPAFRELSKAVATKRVHSMRFSRLSSWTPQSEDVDVVLDLMIHDLDLMYQLAEAEIVDVSAKGTTVLSEQPDFVEAFLKLDNGISVSLTASKASYRKVRAIDVHAADATITADLLTRELVLDRTLTDAYRDAGDTATYEQTVAQQRVYAAPIEPLRAELQSFVECAKQGLPAEVTFCDGARALRACTRVREALA